MRAAVLEAKIGVILKQIDECIAQDNQPDDEPPTPINSKEEGRRINLSLSFAGLFFPSTSKKDLAPKLFFIFVH
jgi:hypothetical protein